MKRNFILCFFIFFCVTSIARADDQRDLNDCMVGDFYTSTQACTRLLETKNHGGTSVANIYTLRGWAYAELGDANKAIADFNKAIELDPHSKSTYLIRSYIYDGKGQHDLAEADKKQVEMLQKENKNLRTEDAIQVFCEGRFFYAIGMTKAPISCFDLAIENNPNLVAAYVRRADIYGARQEYDKALADIQKAIELDPQYSAAFLRRAQYYDTQKQSDKASADYNKAIELNSQYRVALLERGIRIFLPSNQFDKAIADFDKILEFRPVFWDRSLHASLFYWRGIAYEKKGDKKHAEADLRQALALDPSLKEIKEALERLEKIAK